METKKIATKLKIIIIVVFTLVLFGIILLVFNRNVDKRFENYQDLPYDDNFAVLVREVEERDSKYQTGTTTQIGEHEKATFEIQVQMVKLVTAQPMENVKVYIAARTVRKSYRYYDTANSSRTFSDFDYNQFAELAANKVMEEILNIIKNF